MFSWLKQYGTLPPRRADVSQCWLWKVVEEGAGDTPTYDTP